MKSYFIAKLFCFIIFVITRFTVCSQGLSTSSEIIDFCERIELDGNIVGQIDSDSLPSLPIGIHKEIGGITYIIAIDSARFRKNGAYFDAYMALKIPSAENPIAFKATNILFNPKGVIGGALSRLKLVSDQRIEFGPNLSLLLPGDGDNYVEWDCNGFKSVNLKGVFEFSNEILIPTDNKASVEAKFEVYCEDVSDILISTEISPFKIKGIDDVEFSVEQAVVDLSDTKNPENISFPNHFHEQFGSDLDLWRGFYLKRLAVTLPKELQKQNESLVVGVENMFIDNAGFSGNLFASNLMSTSEGDMSGWGFSIEDLNIQIINNQLVGGGIGGKVVVPILDDKNFEYQAQISQNESGELDYNFSVAIDDTVRLSALSVKFDLTPSSKFEINILDGKFKPKFVLYGRIGLESDRTVVNLIEFEGITIVTDKPYVTNGVFQLTSSFGINLMQNFKISIEEFFIHFSETAPILGVNVRMNIGKDPSESGQSGFGISVEGGFRIHTLIQPVVETDQNKIKLVYDYLTLSDIELDISTNVFQFQGVLSFRRNDPVYGNGIAGGILLSLNGILPGPISASTFFGKVDGYRYWFFDLQVPVRIPITPPGIVINKLRGGASYHVEDTRSTDELLISMNQTGLPDLSKYVPNENIGVSFNAGVGFDWSNENVLNADVLFSISLNNSGGLQEVYFLGKVYCLTPRASRGSGSNTVEGTILVHYDNQEKIMDAQIGVHANFAQVIEGNLHLHVYLSPDLWFFKLNTPSNPAHVNLLNFCFIDTYLMVGQELEPMAPPPPMVANLMNIENASSRDTEAILTGDGFAHGTRLQIYAGMEFGWDAFSVYGGLDLGVGYDITIYNYGPDAHCEGSSKSIGMKGWYLQGQIYSYIGFDIGIRGKILGTYYDLPLLEAYLAMYLAGKLPNPTYVEGGVGVTATLLGVFDVGFQLTFSLGNNCNIITT